MTPLRSSLITQGTQRAPNRAMLRAVGFGDGDFSKPIVGVANAYSTLTPCNLGLDVLARRAEATLQTVSTESAITSRETSEYFIPSVPIEIPSAAPSAWTACSPSAGATRTCPAP